MFESIRKHTKIAMFLLFLLIIPSFVLVGIDRNYFSGSSPVAARVDGHDITQAEWDNAHKTESDRRRAEQPGMDAKLLDTPEARYATLERMVRDRVLQAAAKNMHMVTSDSRLARSLQDIPQIAALKKPDGSFDAEAYRALVGAQGMTPEGFEATMRRDLAVGQVMAGVMGTSIATPAQADAALEPLFQRREIQTVVFKPADFAAKVQPTDDDLQAYYKAHPTLFQLPEQATVEYVILDVESLRASIVLNEDDLRTYYKENVDRLAGKEERRASHILITASKDAPAADREKAKARAEELLAQVRKAPASFAEVAKKNSQDPGSAAQGGDLNFFARGAMVKPFEDAAYALKKGDISDVVETDFGYHIILLTDIKSPRKPSFEELRPTMEADLKQQQAQRKFAEVAETFSNSVYEQSDSLQPIADKLKLKIQTAKGVARTPALGATGALANAKFLQSLFSADALEKKRNTEAVETAPNQMVSARVTQYNPARMPALADVKDKVRTLLVAKLAAEQARKAGEARLAALKAKADDLAGFDAPFVVSRGQAHGLTRAQLEAVLGADASKLPQAVGVASDDGAYVVARIAKVLPRDPAIVDDKRAAQQYAAAWARVEGAAYMAALKSQYKAAIKVAAPASSASAP